MTELKLYPSTPLTAPESKNPLPPLLQTPSGLAILEMQGRINLPDNDDIDTMHIASPSSPTGTELHTPIGRLVFPGYIEGVEGNGWMKPVFLYVGRHQRMTGEVKKLPKALAVIRKRRRYDDARTVGTDDEQIADLEVVEIVKWKILFSVRPEPVSTGAGTWDVGNTEGGSPEAEL